MHASILFVCQGQGVTRGPQSGADLTPDHHPAPDPGPQSGRNRTRPKMTIDWVVVQPTRDRSYFSEAKCLISCFCIAIIKPLHNVFYVYR